MKETKPYKGIIKRVKLDSGIRAGVPEWANYLAIDGNGVLIAFAEYPDYHETRKQWGASIFKPRDHDNCKYFEIGYIVANPDIDPKKVMVIQDAQVLRTLKGTLHPRHQTIGRSHA